MTDKKKLRTDIRKRREDFVKSQLNGPDVSLGLPDSLKSLFRSANVVAGYVKLGSEVDPSDLISAAVDMGRTIALPCLIGRATDLVFRKWQPGDPMEQADFGFMQPLPSAEACNPDLILTPLVGFDRALNRLGQGAGYYDRAFARYEDALRIGLAWSVQQMEEVPADPWDMPLHLVITERSLIEAAE